MKSAWRSSAVRWASTLLLTVAGCRSLRDDGARAKPRISEPSPSPSHKAHRSLQPPIRKLLCLYDQKPWINLDTAADLDPEGLQYRIFLDGGAGKGVLRDGTFHIDMYQVIRKPDGTIDRTLVSDWHYPSGQMGTVSAKILGKGYHVQLRWAKKDLAGSEIELVTRFADVDGNEVRSGTKRLRIPKYSS